jgi:hypothetical protein
MAVRGGGSVARWVIGGSGRVACQVWAGLQVVLAWGVEVGVVLMHSGGGGGGRSEVVAG